MEGLGRVEVPNVTEVGVADFHTAGLLRSGASLKKARERARHSDANMTVRYNHIGINENVRALSSLPAPQEVGPDEGKRPNDDREAPDSSEVKAG